MIYKTAQYISRRERKEKAAQTCLPVYLPNPPTYAELQWINRGGVGMAGREYMGLIIISFWYYKATSFKESLRSDF